MDSSAASATVVIKPLAGQGQLAQAPAATEEKAEEEEEEDDEGVLGSFSYMHPCSCRCLLSCSTTASQSGR